MLQLKMYTNEQQAHRQFLMPSSLPKILQSNRHLCALHSERSNGSFKKSYISPKKIQPSSEYTFEPRVNSSQKGRRSLEKFVEDQERYQIEKEKKLTQMRQEINRWEDEQFRGVPNIDSKSKSKSGSKQKGTNVFSRLSRQKLRWEPQQLHSFTPNILPKSKQIQRDKSASNLLYEDAKRRLSKHKIVRQSQQKKITAQSTPKINANTNDYVRKKILSEFMQLISDSILNPLLALSILQELFNVKLRDISSPTVRRIIDIVVNEQGEVLTEKLWSFIAVIIGNSQGYFSQDVELEIKQNYGYFYKERINKDKKYSEPSIPEFRPKTLSNAQILAQKHRQKICKRASEFIENEKVHVNLVGDTIGLEDLFIIQHMRKQKQNERLKMEKQNMDIKQCTFKPKLCDRKPQHQQKQKIVLKKPLKQKNNNHSSSKLTSNQATDRLAASTLLNSIENSKQPTERVTLSNQKKAEVVQRNRRSLDNLTVRMLMARTQRQFQNNMALRKYSKGSNWTEQYNKKHKRLVEHTQRMKGLMHP